MVQTFPAWLYWLDYVYMQYVISVLHRAMLLCIGPRCRLLLHNWLSYDYLHRPGSVNGEVDKFTNNSPPSSDGLSIENKGDNQATGSPMMDTSTLGSLRYEGGIKVH